MSTRRRDFLGAPLAPALAAAVPSVSRAAVGAVIEEHDPSNTKLCRRLRADITDDDLLFLKQIGLRWSRVNFTPEKADFDYIRKTQQRFERFGIKVFSAVHYTYRTLEVQLGQPGRDEQIDVYNKFLRGLGKLGIPVSCYDFHPANWTCPLG